MSPPSANAGPRVAVLIVEDDRDTREALAELLRFEGYTAAAAEGAPEALELLRSGLRPRLMLVDLRMPEMDGDRLRDEIASVADLGPIPLVFLTGAQPSDLPPGAEYLTKPADPGSLLEMVSRYCAGTG